MNWVTYTLFGLTATAYVVQTVRSIRDPDSKAQERLAVLEHDMKGMTTTLHTLTSNHLPHMDAKITDIHGDISSIKSEVMRLATIIEERIPKKA